ncbi:MAG: hypothetical protein II649_10420, partial [Kiritimatiellae bacterium]|nr:hypothetical protein [Kiritimatiellia bacterium]
RLEVELLGFGKLSADPKEALDQLARFATADQNATFASLDKANKTRVGIIAGILGKNAHDAVYDSIGKALAKDGVPFALKGLSAPGKRLATIERFRDGGMKFVMTDVRKGDTVSIGGKDIPAGPGSEIKTRVSFEIGLDEYRRLDKRADLAAYNPAAELGENFKLKMAPEMLKTFFDIK